MKIVHICLCGPVTDGWNYQDNLLTKYHKRLGYEVEIITSKWIWNSKGKLVLDGRNEYINNDFIKVYRLPIKGTNKFTRKFKRYEKVFEKLEKSKPDILFIHGCQFLDIKIIINYLRKKKIKVFLDNHADVENSARNFLSKNILHKIIWRYYVKKIEPYVNTFYGVLPARVDFLINTYKLAPDKVELLVMGIDDDSVKEIDVKIEIIEIRKKYKIAQDDFLIVTGGKIDQNKLQILLLMKAVNKLNMNIKLIIFGSVSPSIKKQFDELLSKKIKYIGWIDAKKTNRYFLTADLVVFPGLHSVFWEQAVGLGKPCVFKYIKGFTHIDLGGNCQFFYQDTIEEMVRVLMGIIENKQLYELMKNNSQNKGLATFSYRNIAARSLKLLKG
jgi:glycosyltransferase involved in cell wall biosynthesis